MSLGAMVVISLIRVLIGIILTWPHSRSWGNAPSGGLGLVMVSTVMLLVFGQVIGKQGRTAQAMRTIIGAVSAKI